MLINSASCINIIVSLQPRSILKESILLLKTAHNNVKAAIIMQLKNLSYKDSINQILIHNGSITKILK